MDERSQEVIELYKEIITLYNKFSFRRKLISKMLITCQVIYLIQNFMGIGHHNSYPPGLNFIPGIPWCQIYIHKMQPE